MSDNKKQIIKELVEFINNRAPEFEVQTEVDNVVYGITLDVYVPDRKLALAVNDRNEVSEEVLTENGASLKEAKIYNQNKTLACEAEGIRLIHIFDDLWAAKKPILQSIIALSLGKPDEIVYARKLEIRELPYVDVKHWLEQNHLYNRRPTPINICLVDPKTDEIYACMTFGKPMHNNAKESFEYELVRYAPKLFTSVVGGPQRLWKYFLKTYNPRSVSCYADYSLFTGSLYKKLGFDFEKYSEPCNWYVTPNNKRYHRGNFTKVKLKRKGIPVYDGINAHKCVQLHYGQKEGWKTFWDCGSLRFYWRNREHPYYKEKESDMDD